ncbi:hypothetical protein M8C21_030852 [Ambrosia artemisiifolia]|uniref:Uncharacterized protein n=1 Tax=Ambrosia artemisiifolia TaxID=4212 RepID=A0AAD5C527_AMBAR|nr:hypothetical protein M8C21_030852 [Ambrosia artemisiifolia]
MSSDGDEQETDYQIRGPPGGLYLGDRGRQGPPWEAGSSGGWVGLYTNHYGTYNPPGPHYSFGTDFCGPAWVGPKETDFSKKNGPRFEGQRVNNFVEDCPETQRERVPEGYGLKVVNADVTGRVRKKIQYDIVKGLNYSGEKGVKTGQDGSFKESSNKPQAQVVNKGSNEGRPKTRRGKRKANKADVNGTKNSCTGSLGKQVVKTDQDDKVADNTVAGEEDIKDDNTDVLLQDSSKPDQWAKSESDSWGKAIENETNFILRSSDKSLDWSKLVEAKVASQHGSGALWGKKGDNKSQAKAVTDGSNEKGNVENQKPGSWWSKEEGCGSKRKHYDSLVGGPNDGPISSGLFTTSKRRADMFTTDEQEIHLNEIEPIVQSIRRIMNQ